LEQWDDGANDNAGTWNEAWMNNTISGSCDPSDPPTCLTLFPDLTDTWGDAIRTGPEKCDDGNTDPGDGWSSTWVVETGYYCRDGNSTTFDNCYPLCGDGRKIEDEEWDDYNRRNGDGCSSSWRLEDGYQCVGGNFTKKDTWSEIWGDSKLMSTLTSRWDDGNTADGDGWNSTCIIETGWTWAGGSSTSADNWQSGCGNGTREGIEEWDDGNNNDGDGWSYNWEVENYYTCEGGNATHQDTWGEKCGDGRRFNTNATYCDDGKDFY